MSVYDRCPACAGTEFEDVGKDAEDRELIECVRCGWRGFENQLVSDADVRYERACRKYPEVM